MSHEEDIKQKLEVLKQQYLANLPGKLKQLQIDWANLLANPNDESQQQTTIRAFHTLAGSGTSFGFPEITEFSRKIENTIKTGLKTTNTIDDSVKTEVETTLESLLAVNLTPTETKKPETDDPKHTTIPVDQQLICLLNTSQTRTEEIRQQIQHYGYRCMSLTNEKEFVDLCERSIPCALIYDLNQTTDHPPLNNFLKLIHQPIPLIAISTRNDTEHRLNAVRLGARAFFSKPIDFPFLIDTLDKLMNIQTQSPYRILIMDDSQATAEFYSYALQSKGMMTHVVTDPMSLMEELNVFSPELILMDLYMPQCSGTELAAVIRQEENYVGTPIVFLSSETDLDKQNLAMSQGGDDFLTKPIQTEHLITAVQTRAERYRKLRSFMVRDSLTGLYNHTSTKELLERELSRMTRSGNHLSYAMVDIDLFKKVNDNYGHSTGDQVIKILARLLKQRLRKTDIVGRYGGEEFAIIMPDTKPDIAARVIDEIRQSFNKIEIPDKTSDLTLSFSAGIAGFPMLSAGNLLNEAADQALYQAKNNGRNRIQLYTIE
jgi:diguanylate cyclase (GGDEF)-like protein